MTMRILHVNDLPLDEGHGAEIHISRLVAAQRRSGDEPHLFTAVTPHTGVRRVLDVWDPGTARGLRRRLLELRPDVVHVHNVVRELSASVLSALTDVPAVMTLHDLRLFGGLEHHLPDPRAAIDRAVVGPLLRRQIRRHVSRVIGVSQIVAEAAAAANLPRATAVPIPVDAPTIALPPPSQCRDVVVAAKLAPDKGVHIAIDAFARIASRHPASRLVVAGDGPDEAALRHQALRQQIPVEFLGRMPSSLMSSVFARARIVAVPSLPLLRPEGASLTAAEAARHGRPVVTSDDPAASEVGRSVAATIVRAGDVTALADALDGFLSDPARADATGAAASRRAHVYDADAVAALVRSLYLDAMR